MTAWRTSWAIWRWPVVLAILTVFGLLSALIGRGGALVVRVVDRAGDAADCDRVKRDDSGDAVNHR